MDWLQVLTIIGVLGAFNFWLSNRIDKQGDRIDKQGDRIDNLYQMWAEMQKEIKDIYLSWNNKNK